MGAAMAVSRLYHSETVLLADGRVVSLGGGHPAADAGGGNNFNLEIYSPPYLFKGARPTITSAPASGANGQTFFVPTPDGATISKVNLVRLNGVTHSFDQNQRLITLPFTWCGGVNVTIPSNSNVTPPGHYWLFLVKNTGVPSIGHMISVQRPYQQSTGADGIISIEVERFHDNVAQGGRTWNRVTPSGASGTGAQQSLPNNGATVDTGFATGCPRMDFWVNFTKTGVHHVWGAGRRHRHRRLVPRGAGRRREHHLRSNPRVPDRPDLGASDLGRAGGDRQRPEHRAAPGQRLDARGRADPGQDRADRQRELTRRPAPGRPRARPTDHAGEPGVRF